MGLNMTESTANDAGLDMRGRLSVFGPEHLSEAELLAIALGKNAAQTEQIFESVGGLGGLLKKTATELCHAPHVGKPTAQRIVAMIEFSRRFSRVGSPWGAALRHPSDAAGFVRGELRGKTQEHFVLIGMDSRQRVMLFRTVGVGSLAQVDVHPRELFRPCIRNGVHAVILAHNHPSGDPEPSEADVELTRRMAEVGKLVGIPVLDHLVVTDDDFCSLAALGLLPRP